MPVIETKRLRLRHWTESDRPELGLGYWLMPEYRGNGYALESC